jgi:hypothetical protein
MSESVSIKHYFKYGLVVGTSVLVGIGIFIGTAFLVGFVWTYLVVRGPENLGPGDGFFILLASIMFGSILGFAGLILTLNRFWPPGNDRLDHDS